MTKTEQSDTGPVFLFKGDTTTELFFRVQKGLLPSWNTPYTFLAVFFLLFVVMGQDWSSPTFDAAEMISSLPFFLFISAFYVGLIWFARKSAWRKTVELHGPVHGKLDNAGIEWHTSHTVTKYKWSELKKKKILPGLILVFYTPRCAFYFPREFLSSDEQWAALESFVESKIVTT